MTPYTPGLSLRVGEGDISTAVMEDKAYEVQQQLSCQNLRAFSGFIGRGHLNKVNADDLASLG